MILLSGKEPADSLLSSLRTKVSSLNPHLVIVQVGSDAASTAYVRAKLKACEQIELRVTHTVLPNTVTHEALVDTVRGLNAGSDVSGYILQLPLPEHLWNSLPLVLREVDPNKDVDGMTARNLGKTFLSSSFEHLPPATPAGIISLLEHYNISVAGKHVVVVGRSNLVGKPLSIMLLNRDATVTVCHSKTKHLEEYTQQADILVCAVGKPGLITGDMIKKGITVIDVGITREDGKLVGDVDVKTIEKKAGALSPVPGGVGPMTIASLLRNVIRAKERQVERANCV